MNGYEDSNAVGPSMPMHNQWGEPPQRDRDALEYRLEGADTVERVTDLLRGGVIDEDDDGNKTFDEKNRLMNELGVSKTEMFLHGFVNKNTHLTKYKNEERVLIQMRSGASAYNFELTLNMKRWGPEFIGKLQDDESVEQFCKRTGAVVFKFVDAQTVRYRVKVRNPRLVRQLVENSMLASMQRGDDGFEAGNTIKQINVNEVRDLAERQQPGGMIPQAGGFFSRFFGGP